MYVGEVTEKFRARGGNATPMCPAMGEMRISSRHSAILSTVQQLNAFGHVRLLFVYLLFV
jgi:hypothetical protein